MLDHFLPWIVVIAPTFFALGLEVIDERVRKHPYWHYGVIAFGLTLSGLTWWQQSRETSARENAIQETSQQVAAETSKQVTRAVTEQYSQMVADQKRQIADLQDQLTAQGKDVSVIKGSNIVTGKNPVKVEVTNPFPPGEPQTEFRATVNPIEPNLKFGTRAEQIFITTNRVMNGARVSITCKGKINSGNATLAGSSVTMGGGRKLDDHTFITGIEMPNWSPTYPLIVTFYFDGNEGIDPCTITPLP